jgi:hypothetical protein
VSGQVWAAVPHGHFTNISSTSGDVTAFAIPFGVDSLEDQSEVYTFSRSGNTYVHMLDTIQESLQGDKKDPLLNTTSRHKVSVGSLHVRYPYSWYGNLEGHVDSGELTFDSSALEEFKRGERWVQAKRGKDGISEVEVLVGTGHLNIEIGL